MNPTPVLQKGLPNRFYVTREEFFRERELIFSSMWISIGFASEVPNAGDTYPLEFMELPLLILRGEDLKLRVFHNVCPHRGHILVSESRNLKKFLRCPYHSWTFHLDGQLVHTPHIGGVGVRELKTFDPSCHGMREIRSMVWNDLVFMNIDGKAEPFQQFIQPLEDRWQSYWGKTGPSMLKRSQTDDNIVFELETNWKLVVENYLEAYHLPSIHPELNRISSVKDHEIFIEDQFSGQISHNYSYSSSDDIPLPLFPEWPSDQISYAEYPVLYPNTLFGLQADHFYVMVILPLQFNRTREEARIYRVGEESLEGSFSNQRTAQHKFWQSVFQEDVEAVSAMQKGRSSIGFDGGVLTPVMESATAAFHNWTADKLKHSLNASA